MLRSAQPGTLTTARDAGSYPLVPFSNRVGHASLQWNGTSHPLVRNFGAEPHAIHGVGWQRAWTVLEADTAFALLSYEHKPDAYWPFAFDTSQAFRLTPEGLELSLSITNQSDKPVPVGMGWHPFFIKRPGGRIDFDATGRWEMGPEKLPTHRLASQGIHAPCASLDVDHCYDGWNGTVQLHDDVLDVRLTSGLSRLVVFTNATREFVAVEPVSHVNNAINMVSTMGLSAADLGLHVLQPAESMSCSMGIFARRAA